MSSEKRRIDVMVSGTSKDLEAHRQAAIAVINQLKLTPLEMSLDPASDEDPLGYSLRLVNESEIYVGIISFRYGFIPEDSRNPDALSMTELEYRRAWSRRSEEGLPKLLLFLMDEKHPRIIAEIEDDTEKKKKLEAFRNVVGTRHRAYLFKSVEDFKHNLLLALQETMRAFEEDSSVKITLKAGASFDGRYTLMRLLGAGGNGEVWLASEPKPDGSSERQVALKVLKADVSADPRRIARFKSEVSKAIDLKHQHIARALTYGEVAGQFYAVMDYIEGESFKDFIAGKQFSELETANYLEQIAHALDYAHSLHIVHRDVKPANILVSWAEGNRLYLTDFGLAVSDEEENSLTETGELVGTKRYMSPEQWRGEDCTLATDVYALGIIAYELLTGSVPFEAKTHLLLGQLHLNEPLPAHPAIKDEVLAVLRRACAKNPKERYVSASDFVHALRHWQIGEENLAARVEQYASKLRAVIHRDVYEKFVDLSGDRHSLQALLKAQVEEVDDFARAFMDYDTLLLNATEAQVEADHETADRGERHYVEDVREKLLQLKRAVLVGEPGAGKTWMMWRLTLEYLDKLADKGLIPVFVPLNLFKGQNAKGEKQSFEDFVRQWMPNLAPYHDELRQQWRLVILCDALNEMARQAADGHELLPELIDYLRDCPAFVVSCRVRDYKDDLRELHPLEQVILRDLELPAIEQLVKRRLPEAQGQALWQAMGGNDLLYSFWQAIAERGRLADFWVSSTNWAWYLSILEGWQAWRAMHNDPRRLMPLCRNPFMATMVCVVYLNGKGQLPSNRAELFKQFIDNLLKREALTAKKLNKSFPIINEIESALSDFSMLLQERKETALAKIDVLADSRLAVAENLLHAATDANLLLDDGLNWKFSHQLIQEYFATRILLEILLADEATGQSRAEDYLGASWWDAGVWRETLVILGEFLGEGAKGANRVARWLAPVSPDLALDVIRHNGAGLNLGNDLESVTKERILEGAKTKTNEVHPIGRTTAYRILGLFKADERPGIGLLANGLPDIAWGKIVPIGLYKIGSDGQAEGSLPSQEIHINYSYCLAKYPVTMAQFQTFIASEGGITSSKWWKDIKREKKAYQQKHPYLNHPRDNVSWFQAVAFCRWLTAKYHEADLLEKNWEIRLPTQNEWEIAASYPDGRIFPYGNKANIDAMNVQETLIRKSTPVGIFSIGCNESLDLYDMAGNVWEFCLSNYDDGSNLINIRSNSRVMRGGSFIEDANSARAASRISNNPSYYSGNVGFRVATAPMGVLNV